LSVDKIDSESYLYLVSRGHHEVFSQILHLPVKKETRLKAWESIWKEEDYPHKSIVMGIAKSSVDEGGFSTSIVPLLDCEQEIDTVDWAISTGHYDLIKLLIDHSKFDLEYYLSSAVNSGNLEILKLFLESFDGKAFLMNKPSDLEYAKSEVGLEYLVEGGYIETEKQFRSIFPHLFVLKSSELLQTALKKISLTEIDTPIIAAGLAQASEFMRPKLIRLILADNRINPEELFKELVIKALLTRTRVSFHGIGEFRELVDDHLAFEMFERAVSHSPPHVTLYREILTVFPTITIPKSMFPLWSTHRIPNVSDSFLEQIISRMNVAATDLDLLLKAINSQNVKLVRILLKTVHPGLNDNEALFEAVKISNLDVIQLLLQDRRVNPNARNSSAISKAMQGADARINVHVVTAFLNNPRLDLKKSKFISYLCSLPARLSHAEILQLAIQRGGIPSYENFMACIKSNKLEMALTIYKCGKIDPTANDYEAALLVSAMRISALRGKKICW
jgi:hypothetical protein